MNKNVCVVINFYSYLKQIQNIIISTIMALFLVLSSSATFSQETKFPTKTVTLLLPYPTGGVADAVARRMSERLSALWKVPVIVSSKPGAGGNLGAGIVAKADPDGYTILLTVYDGLVITKAFAANVGFDPARDLTAVALPTLSTTVIVAHPSIPPKDFTSFARYAKANPGKLNFGSNGIGSSYHLALEQLNAVMGTDILHVPYKGSAQVMIDLIAGRLDATIVTAFLALPYVNDGRVRAVAIASAERSPLFPGIPTIAESGYPGYEASVGMGVFVPAGTPEALITRLNTDISKVMNEADLRKQFLNEGTVTTNLTASEVALRFQKDVTAMQLLIARKNIKLDF